MPFDEGLAATVAWYRDHRDWWEPLKPVYAVTAREIGLMHRALSQFNIDSITSNNPRWAA